MVTTGAAAIVKFAPPDVPPPGGGVETVTVAVLAVAMSALLMTACNVELDTKVLERALPFHWMMEEEMKVEPVTVRVNAEPPAVAEVGLRDDRKGAGLFGGGL